jgi:hypothetical protein
MSIPLTPIILAALSGLVAVAAVSTARRTQAARANHAALITRRAELAAKLRHWESELAAPTQGRLPPTTVVEVPASSQLPPSVPAAASTAAGEPAAAATRAASSFLEWMEDPKVQVLWFAKERAELAPSYGPFFRRRGLSPEQIEKLSDLIVQWRAHSHDMSEINRQKGIGFNDPALVAQRERGEAEFKAGVTAFLGADGYAALRDYARALEIRTFVSRFAGVAAVAGPPVNGEQAEVLVQLLANSCPGYGMGGPANLNRIDWNSADPQLTGILSAGQAKLLRTDPVGGAGSLRRAQLSQAVFRARAELKAAGRLPEN